MKTYIVYALAILGTPLVILAQVTGIGVFLYSWGVEDMAIGASAWLGFKYWISMLVVGIISIFTAIIVKD